MKGRLKGTGKRLMEEEYMKERCAFFIVMDCLRKSDCHLVEVNPGTPSCWRYCRI